MNKFFKGFTFAFRGIGLVFSSQLNFKVHVFAFILAVLLGIFLHISQGEWLAIILISSMVMMAEAFNTAIEYLVDYISLEKHPMAGKIKDIAAGAVLIVAIFALLMALFIFVPKLIDFAA